MSLNCNELNLILQELDLKDSYLQEIVQPSFDMLGFRTIRKGELTNIVICTGNSVCRINATGSRIPKNDKPLRFYEFLKSRIQGMRINSCRQLGLDRIVKLDVSTWQTRYFMYIKLWSGAANVIVTDEDNLIIDCMYRRPKKDEFPGKVYRPEEHVPGDEEKLRSLEKFPVRDFSGFKEEWQSAHEGQNFDDLSFNQKIDLYYSEHASVLSRESLLRQAERWYNVKHSKMMSALEKLEAKKKSFESSENLKHTGDLILSFGTQAEGFSLDCIDYDTGKEVHIRLDPKKSVQENAACYYEQYKKARSGMENLVHDIDLSRKAIAALDAEYQSIISQKNVLKIEQMLRHDTAPKQKIQKTHAGLHYEVDGWTIIVGRTANENDDLLRHTVRGQDMWLHTRDFAGGYVFIKARSGKTVPLEILLYAGNLAVYHSKARRNGQADLYYTQVKHLRRAKDGPKGLVLPTNEKNLFIKLDDAKLRYLDDLEKSSQPL